MIDWTEDNEFWIFVLILFVSITFDSMLFMLRFVTLFLFLLVANNVILLFWVYEVEFKFDNCEVLELISNGYL